MANRKPSNFLERFQDALVIRDMKQADITRLTGINRSSISQYASGKFEPKQDKIDLISQALRVNPVWLRGYDVPMERVSKYENKNRVDTMNNSVEIPLLGRIAAGTPILAEENIEKYFSLDSSIRADFCLEVQGNSMIDEGIHDGDVVFLRHQQTLENGEIGAVVIGEEATLKSFYRFDGYISLNAANKDYQPIIINDGDVRIAGKLVAVLNIR